MKRLISNILGLMLLFPASLWAENAGQIINVNQSYQIAFTDLGNQTLKQGDVVKVYVNDSDFIYMQVLESSAILSKLGLSQQEDYKTNLDKLSLVAVGNKVTTITEEAKSKPDVSTDDDANSQEISELLKKLQEAKAQIAHLQQVNQSLKTQITQLETQVQGAQNPSVDNTQLKDKLQKIQQLLNQE